MNREQLIELRPLIPSAETAGTNSLEGFQNEVLRPILKFQQEFIAAYFRNNAQFSMFLKNKGPRIEFHEKVQRFIGTQIPIKNQLIGSIIGQLTEKELVFYWQHSSDLNKRIHQMLCQRVSDTFY